MPLGKPIFATGGQMSQIIREFDPNAVLHLAAESHVDRSIDPRAIH
jgi:dTDP-D-glucose 4,6-dehydratase